MAVRSLPGFGRTSFADLSDDAISEIMSHCSQDTLRSLRAASRRLSYLASENLDQSIIFDTPSLSFYTFQKLRILNVQNGSDSTLEKIAQNCPLLTWLSMLPGRNDDLYGFGIAELARSCPSLEYLRLILSSDGFTYTRPDQDAFLALGKHCPKLRYLAAFSKNYLEPRTGPARLTEVLDEKSIAVLVRKCLLLEYLYVPMMDGKILNQLMRNATNLRAVGIIEPSLFTSDKHYDVWNEFNSPTYATGRTLRSLVFGQVSARLLVNFPVHVKHLTCIQMDHESTTPFGAYWSAVLSLRSLVTVRVINPVDPIPIGESPISSYISRAQFLTLHIDWEIPHQKAISLYSSPICARNTEITHDLLSLVKDETFCHHVIINTLNQRYDLSPLGRPSIAARLRGLFVSYSRHQPPKSSVVVDILTHAPDLEHFVIGNCVLTESQFALVASQCHNLRTFFVGPQSFRTELTVSVVESLMKNNPHLVVVSITNMNGWVDALSVLGRNGNGRRLKILSLGVVSVVELHLVQQLARVCPYLEVLCFTVSQSPPENMDAICEEMTILFPRLEMFCLSPYMGPVGGDDYEEYDNDVFYSYRFKTFNNVPTVTYQELEIYLKRRLRIVTCLDPLKDKHCFVDYDATFNPIVYDDVSPTLGKFFF